MINGEGSLHGWTEHVRTLLYLAYAAKVHLGKNVQIINHSCYPEDTSRVTGSPTAALYLKVYRAVDFVAVREPHSFHLLEQAGIPAIQAFDCLPLHVRRHHKGGVQRQPDEIVMAGSAALRETDLATWTTYIRNMVDQRRRVRVLVGANMFPAPDDRAFAQSLEQRVPGTIELVNANRMDVWLDTIARASLVVSGRFHHTVAAAALNTPFVLLGSNTPKNAGLAEALHAPQPLSLDSPRLLEEMLSRTEAALGEGGHGEGDEALATMCDAAMKNFLALPGIGPDDQFRNECATPSAAEPLPI